MDAKVLETLRTAVGLSPDNAALRRHLAEALSEAGLHDEALTHFQKALATLPGDAATLRGLGVALHHLGKHEEAAARLQESLRADPQNAPAHLAMARVLLELKQLDKARRSYQTAREMDASLADSDLEARLAPPRDNAENPRRVPVGPGQWDEMEDDPFADDDAETAARKLGLDMERPTITFGEVGGMDELKEEIRVNIIYPFLHPEIYAAYGKKVGSGILLYGPPGCGKTYIARATAGECKANFIVVGVEDVLDMWMGESEKKLHLIFETARRNAPTVLFFDELDALAGKRSDMSHSPHMRAVVNQFLAETDGAKGDNSNLLIVGATNSPWYVDAAFRRPGRFDKVIFVPPPDQQARVEILKIHSTNKPVENLDYEKIAARMKRFSGADIAAVCDAAAEIGLRETLKTGKLRKLNNGDFLAALKTMRPTTDEWLATARNYALYANQTGLYDAIAEYLRRNPD